MSLFSITHSDDGQVCGHSGPEPGLPLGTAGDFLKRGRGSLRRLRPHYGRMTLIWLAGTPAIVLNDPDLIHRVLDSEAASYYRATRTTLSPRSSRGRSVHFERRPVEAAAPKPVH